jgi:hypothetical protein
MWPIQLAFRMRINNFINKIYADEEQYACNYLYLWSYKKYYLYAIVPFCTDNERAPHRTGGSDSRSTLRNELRLHFEVETKCSSHQMTSSTITWLRNQQYTSFNKNLNIEVINIVRMNKEKPHIQFSNRKHYWQHYTTHYCCQPTSQCQPFYLNVWELLVSQNCTKL